MTRVVFMGTPEFAVPALTALAENHSMVGVVTQPDRRAGRGSRLCFSAVKTAAQGLGLDLYQPESLRAAEAQARLATWEPEVIVVAAFGQILPPGVLDLPLHGCLNLHASLLPRWRGADPITSAIWEGDAVTGITVMQMDEGLDTGPILLQREMPIQPDITKGELEADLAKLSAALILEVLPAYVAGELTPQPQPEEGVTYSRKLTKADQQLDWTQPAVVLDRQVRALYPSPGAVTACRGERMKIVRAAPLPDWQGGLAPGTVITIKKETAVVTGQGALLLLEVQRPGRKVLPIEAFVCGQQDFVGSVLTECQNL